MDTAFFQNTAARGAPKTLLGGLLLLSLSFPACGTKTINPPVLTPPDLNAYNQQFQQSLTLQQYREQIAELERQVAKASDSCSGCGTAILAALASKTAIPPSAVGGGCSAAAFMAYLAYSHSALPNLPGGPRYFYSLVGNFLTRLVPPGTSASPALVARLGLPLLSQVGRQYGAPDIVAIGRSFGLADPGRGVRETIPARHSPANIPSDQLAVMPLRSELAKGAGR